MTGIESAIAGKIVSEAAKPLIAGMKRTLARRGYGKTEFFSSITSTQESSANFSAFSILDALPRGVTNRDVQSIIDSPDFLRIARTLLAAEFAQDTTIRQKLRTELKDLFYREIKVSDRNWNNLEGTKSSLEKYCENLSEILEKHCLSKVSETVKRLQNPSEMLDWAYKTTSIEYLNSIAQQVSEIATGGNGRDIASWQDQYVKSFTSRHSEINVPDLMNRRKVPYDDLFVGSTFTALSQYSEDLCARVRGRVTDQNILPLLHRAVFLGDPGAGKSTTSTLLALRFLREYSLIPIIIVLKEVQFTNGGFSVIDTIKAVLKSKYQCPLREAQLNNLLLDGRIVLIFDGLDELIDGTNRKDTVEVIETTALLYPLSKVLVTSRSIGYTIASLRKSIFDEFQINRFDDTQVKDYVTKWLRLQEDTDDSAVSALAKDFMQTSESMTDLRSNPLLLAFICLLYRGHKTIPRRRPELYRKCAELLISEWDKSRGIVKDVFDFDLYEIVLTRLAFDVLTTKRTSLTESQVFEISVPALIEEEVPNERSARSIIDDILHLCRGRAWIFTDVGLDDDGSDIFFFTHPSFVEYFAARHIHRFSNSPEEMADLLLPEIENGSWGVLGQICLSLSRHGWVAGASRGSIRMLERAEHLLQTKRKQERTKLLSPGHSAVNSGKISDKNADVAIVEFLMRTSDIISLSSEALNHLIDLSFSQLVDGRSKTLGILLEPHYRYHEEALKRIIETLNEILTKAAAYDGTSDIDSARAWIATHFSYLPSFARGIEISSEAHEKVCKSVDVKHGNWSLLAEKSRVWRNICIHLGRIELDTYNEVFEPTGRPFPGFGPISTADWIMDCFTGSHAQLTNKKVAASILRRVYHLVHEDPYSFGLRPVSGLEHKQSGTFSHVLNRLTGYGEAVVGGWAYVAMGAIELSESSFNSDRAERVKQEGLQEILDYLSKKEIIREPDQWITGSKNIWNEMEFGVS